MADPRKNLIIDQFRTRIVLAPLAGGPSTPELTAAASEAGAFSFLAGGYLSASELRRRMEQTRALTAQPFGVNLFVPGSPTPREVFRDYEERLGRVARRLDVHLGDGRFDDDDWQAKLDLVLTSRTPVVSFTFGCPETRVIERLHDAGSEVWVTVTRTSEARIAEERGADVLVVQGSEAGGHRGSFHDQADNPPTDEVGLLSLLQLVRHSTSVPVVATGGIASGLGIAGALAGGAIAAAIGTAFLTCPEAGTNQAHRDCLPNETPTILTRAFTGRLARGIRNDFIDDHGADAPVAYPEIHYLTAPLRQAGRDRANPQLLNLWAGQAHSLCRREPAAALISRLWSETLTALDEVAALRTRF